MVPLGGGRAALQKQAGGGPTCCPRSPAVFLTRSKNHARWPIPPLSERPYDVTFIGKLEYEAKAEVSGVTLHRRASGWCQPPLQGLVMRCANGFAGLLLTAALPAACLPACPLCAPPPPSPPQASRGQGAQGV